ncbi:MAG: POTRA domain-containing protein [Bacteroidota bacterium]
MSEKASPRFVWPGFFCLMVVIGWTGIARSQDMLTIGSVGIYGNKAISTNALLAVLALRAGDQADSATLALSLGRMEAFYREQGFLFARATADSRQADSVAHLRVTIDEGLPAVVHSMTFVGNHHLVQDDLISVMEVRSGDRFVETLIERDINALLALYEKRGFPTARVSVFALEATGDETQALLKIRLEVEEGVKAIVEEILLEGNKTTKDEVILREVRPKTTDLFTDSYAARVRRSLERLRLFTSVESPQFFLSGENKGVMLIRVREGDPNRFDGMIGYSPTQQGGGVVTGLADVQFGNLFGTGRRLSVRWMRESSISQDLTLRYFEPWVASLPIHAEIGFLQRKQDSTFINRTYQADVTISLADDVAGALSVEQSQTVPGERAQNPVLSSTQWSLGASLSYDTRDNPITPTGGLLYKTGYEFGRKSVAGGASETRRLTFELDVFYSLGARQVLVTSVRGKGFSSSLIAQSDLFRLGGATTLRGYRENQFQGSRIGWASLEYRFLTGGRSYFYGFLDGGYVSVPDRPAAGLTPVELTRLGYGTGARLETGLGLITVGLAFGEGDTFRTAKLHLRLSNEF